MVMIEEHVGTQEREENEEVAPVGRPEIENDTGTLMPDSKLEVMGLVIEFP